MWILRWPIVVLILVFVIAACLLPAGAVTANELAGPQFAQLSQGLADNASSANWLQAGLWYGAAFCLFVAAVRLIRRTQAFWAWLIGFGLYGARWGLARQAEGVGVPTSLDAALADYGLLMLSGLLLVGLLILIVDAADRSHWARRDA
ncbi:MAG: hypothetical protein JNJ73_08235 [Hyphomonadaceae bacterium]|nr:hypothetical protein [Hyphomonadaceae bacterium]